MEERNEKRVRAVRRLRVREGDENDRRDRSPLPYSWGRKGKKCQTCLWQVLSRNGLSLSRKKEVGVFR